MESKEIVIDLHDFRCQGRNTFSTAAWGIATRNACRIDDLAEKNEFIVIKLSEKVPTVTTSFLEEFLENVVIKFGSTDFFKKFRFDHNPHYTVEPIVKEAVHRIVRQEETTTPV